MIPFSDTPIVSRFGPISRRGNAITRPSKPSQTQAIIDDEPMPTAVVRHSKQMTKQLPPTASLILQNGCRAALQAVAVGANGEIGYIAVPEPVTVTPTQQVPTPEPIQIQTEQGPMDPAMVFAESERMKHELQVLQKKISDLNVAQQQFQLMQQQQMQMRVQPAGAIGGAVEDVPQQQVNPGAMGGKTRHLELASELQLIEKTIKDREMELQINTCMQKDSPKGLDYGSYISHGKALQNLVNDRNFKSKNLPAKMTKVGFLAREAKRAEL